MESRCDVVFLDAGGTLFQVRGSVGELYAAVARARGFELDDAELNRSFDCAIAHHGPLAFSGLDEEALRTAERAWWLAIVRDVFAGRMPEEMLERCFDDLYELFRKVEAWHLFEEVPAALEALRSLGCRLGVISNFDSRLDDVLDVLGIGGFFEHVIVSSRAGAAKPAEAIFRRGMELFGAAPERCCHAGDSLRDDVEGARAAGLGGVLVDRLAHYRDYEGARVASLAGLPEIVRTFPSSPPVD